MLKRILIAVAVLMTATAIYSRDIVDWQILTYNAGFANNTVLIGASKPLDGWRFSPFYAVGQSGNVYRSYNAVDWTTITLSASYTSMANSVTLSYDNKLWVLGGFGGMSGAENNEVWYSANGSDWTLATGNAQWEVRAYHAGAVFDNKMWIIGGQGVDGLLNDVWYSTDGVDWTAATQNAEWCGRDSHKAVVFNDEMYITGGDDWLLCGNELGYGNEVYKSANGVEWTALTRNAEWTPSWYYELIATDEAIYMIGGVPKPGTVVEAPVWKSTDGIVWTAQQNTPKKFGYGGSFLSFNDDIYIVGGIMTGAEYAEVWKAVWASATATPSPTLTHTVTPYVANTSTSTFTRTFTRTVTRTITPTSTITKTRTPSFTLTPLPSRTNTNTITETHTVSPTFTATPTISQTWTVSPTWTLSPTPSVTPTNTTIPTPYIAYVSSGEDAKYPLDSVKLEWNAIPNAEYDLYYEDTNRGITWVKDLTNTNNTSDDTGRFIYELKSLILGNLYNIWLKLKYGSTEQASNIISVRPITTPTFEPTPLSFCFDVCAGMIKTPETTNSTTFTDTALTCQVQTTLPNEPVFVYASYQVSSGSGAGARVASHRIVSGGTVSLQLNRYLSGTNDTGIGGIISILYPANAGTHLFHLQHKSNSSARYVTLTKGDIVAVPLESADGLIQLPNSYSTLDSTGTTIAGNTYVDASSLTGTVTLDVAGKILVGAAFNCAWGDAVATTRTGYWNISVNETPIAEIGRYMGIAADEGAVVLTGLSGELAAGTHNIKIQHKTDVPVLAVKTYNGRLTCIGLAVQEGAAYGSYVPAESVFSYVGVTTTSQSYTDIPSSSVSITLTEAGGGVASFSSFNSLAGDGTGNSRTVSYRTISDGTVLSSEYSRYLTGTGLGAVNGIGYTSALTDGTYTYDIQHKTDNVSNPITSANISHVVIGSCIEPMPTPTP